MLPTLIFTETHFDEKSARVFNELIPRLSQQYKTFYEESPQGKTLKEAIRAILHTQWAIEDEYEDYQQTIAEYSDVYGGEVTEFIERHRHRPLEQREFLWKLYFQVLKTHDQLLTINALLQTYSLLEEHHLNFMGIDSPEGYQQFLKICQQEEQGIPVSAEDEAQSSNLRNASMIDAYVNISKPTMGRIGLKHLKPIQDGILKKVGSLDNYLFIYIYSENSSFKFSQLLPDKVQNIVEINEISNPDNPHLHKLNADIMTVDEIYNYINSLINNNNFLKDYSSATKMGITHFKLDANHENHHQNNHEIKLNYTSKELA